MDYSENPFSLTKTGIEKGIYNLSTFYGLGSNESFRLRLAELLGGFLYEI
jgi:hypothetical protein